MIILTVAVAVVGTTLATVTAYTAYVDARFLAGNQLREIKVGIEFLCDYRNDGPIGYPGHLDNSAPANNQQTVFHPSMSFT